MNASFSDTNETRYDTRVERLTRRSFIGAAGAVAVAAMPSHVWPALTPQADEVLYSSVVALSKAVRSGSVSSEELVTAFLDRIAAGGQRGDGQTSITYDPATGEVGVDAPAGTNVTSVNIDSAQGIFVNYEVAQNLDGSFDTSSDDNIFKATFGSSFGSLSFGTVATPGLAEDFVANDLTVIGSLDGGGGLGDVDLVYVPEPSAVLLFALGVVGLLASRRRLR